MGLSHTLVVVRYYLWVYLFFLSFVYSNSKCLLYFRIYGFSIKIISIYLGIKCNILFYDNGKSLHDSTII